VAVVCPIDLDVASLRAEVQTIYSRVATSPDSEFHFHRGPRYAATMLGYEATELAALPADVTSSFAGVGNPHAVGRFLAWSTLAVGLVPICCWRRGWWDLTVARSAST
jgi:hypothetical protein